MPTPVLVVLVLLVGAYVLLAGGAFVGLLSTQHQAPPPAPSAWPKVTVMVPPEAHDPQQLASSIQSCDYPPDRLHLVFPAEPSPAHSSDTAAVRGRSVPQRTSTPPLLQTIAEEAEGEIVLTAPTGNTVPSGWIQSMVRRCTDDTPVVVGPSTIEHDDLFLPRLQALSQLGSMAWRAGATYFNLPTPAATSNWAIRVETGPNTPPRPESVLDSPTSGPTTFNPDPEAAIERAPVDSFQALLHRFAQDFRRAFETNSTLAQSQGLGIWLVHTALLVCALVAVAVPAWRQPTLLALLAKMGTDVLLTLPAAKQYGERTLLRSLVPTELMLVLALPIAGLWSLVLPFSQKPNSVPK